MLNTFHDLFFCKDGHYAESGRVKNVLIVLSVRFSLKMEKSVYTAAGLPFQACHVQYGQRCTTLYN
jgi:hypothetical protein